LFAILKKMCAHPHRRSTLTSSSTPCVNLFMTYSIIWEKSHMQGWRQMQKSQLHTMSMITSKECLWLTISAEKLVKSLELYQEDHNLSLPFSECYFSTFFLLLLNVRLFLLFLHTFSPGNFQLHNFVLCLFTLVPLIS